MRRTLFLLPNLITLSSVLCGFYAMVVAGTARGADDWLRAALLILFAMFCDGLDGRVARLTRTQSAFGLQLDSLADVVSFGVAPALLVHSWTLHRLGVAGMLGACAFVACGAIRLARFNVLSTDERGAPAPASSHFVGLPIPAAAGLLVSLILADGAVGGLLGTPPHAPAVLAVTVGLAGLMVSTIRFRTFKGARFDRSTLLGAAFALASSIAVAAIAGPGFVLVWALGAYVLLGLGEWLLRLPRRLRPRAAARDSSAPPAPE